MIVQCKNEYLFGKYLSLWKIKGGSVYFNDRLEASTLVWWYPLNWILIPVALIGYGFVEQKNKEN